jgi:precorrin-3B methylase
VTAIFLAGLGIGSVTQVTREVEAALRASKEVLFLDTGVATRTYLEQLCPRVTDLYAETYRAGKSRLSGYEHAAIRVVEAALDHPPVAFALHGHPLIAATPPFLVREMARALGLGVKILPGVSAIDTVLADLGVDPVVDGIQMFEASDVLLRRRPLQADVPALLWQIGPIETALHSEHVARPERFDRFIAHLRRYYPQGHEIAAVYSAPHPLLPAQVLRFPLERMGSHAAELHHGFTLYVPPAFRRPVLDHEAAIRLYSAAHLRAITAV